MTTLAARSGTSGVSVLNLFRAVREYGIVVAFVLLFVVLSIASPNFLTFINLMNTLESGSVYGIVAIGLTVLLISGEFDLSAGAIYVLAGIVGASLQPIVGTAPALFCGVMAAFAIGAVNGVIVTHGGINSFIATLATSLMIVGLGTLITNGFQLYISDPGFGELGNGKLFGVTYIVWIFFAFALASGLVLNMTKVGRWVYATGGNQEAARLSGVNVKMLRVAAFAFSGFAGGVAGVILVSRTSTAIAGDGMGDVLFPAIAAVVVGGTSIQGGRGAVWRTVLGIFFLEFIRNGFNLLEVNPYFQNIIRGGIILIAVGADALSRRKR